MSHTTGQYFGYQKAPFVNLQLPGVFISHALIVETQDAHDLMGVLAANREIFDANTELLSVATDFFLLGIPEAARIAEYLGMILIA
jgi:hypothetical protein